MGAALVKPETRVKPTREELVACVGKSIRDVIAPGLRVLFCGINPGLYSGWTGHAVTHRPSKLSAYGLIDDDHTACLLAGSHSVGQQ